MQLDFAFLCTTAEFLNDGRVVALGAGTTQIALIAEPPVSVELCVVVKGVLDAGETTDGHTVALDIVKPSGEYYHKQSPTPFKTGRPDELPEAGAGVFIFRVGVLVSELGKYLFRVIIDGAHQKEMAFYVTRKDQGTS